MKCHTEDHKWDDNMLCSECRAASKFRYWFLLRPPGIGCMPHGWALKEYWQPTQKIPGTERYAHGWVEYTKSLAHEQVWFFDLLPAQDEDAYWAWREEENR